MAASRTISLIASRNSSAQRAHFAIFVPSASDPDAGTLINVVGAPMAGYQLQFERNHSLATVQQQAYTHHPIGQIDSQYVAEDESTGSSALSKDCIPRGAVERVASQVKPPGISQNFMAPVNDTTNRRCQEWTMEYVRRLVDCGYIDVGAVDIVQSKRDTPSHGIGLQPVQSGGRQ